MDSIITTIGIVIGAWGAVCLIKPDVLKRMMEFFKQDKRLYLAGLIRFGLAIVFLLGARECDITWVITTFGIVFLISGLLIFTLGLEKVKSIVDWWQKQSVLLLRVLAIIVLAIGAIIIYSA